MCAFACLAHSRTLARGVAKFVACRELSYRRRYLSFQASRHAVRRQHCHGWRGLSAYHHAQQRASRCSERRRLSRGWCAFTASAASEHTYQKVLERSVLIDRMGSLLQALRSWRERVHHRHRHWQLADRALLVHHGVSLLQGLVGWRELVCRRSRTCSLLTVGRYVAFRRRCGTAMRVWRCDVTVTRRQAHAAVSELGRQWAESRWGQGPCLLRPPAAGLLPSLDVRFEDAHLHMGGPSV